MKSLCLVANTIDENVHALSEILRETHLMTIYCVGEYEHSEHESYRDNFKKLNIEYISLIDNTTNYPIIPKDRFTVASYSTYEYLKKNHFDFVVFGVNGANGFFSIQAKETSKYLNDTSIFVYADKPSQLLKYEASGWNTDPVQDMKLWYAERFCVEHADFLIFPSKDMFDWFNQNAWKYAENYDIIPFLQISEDRTELINRQLAKIFDEKKPNVDMEIINKIEKENPLISICIAHYNHPEYLPAALESISKTTYSNYEVIVVDDGSPSKEAHEVFDDSTKKYDLPNWNFYKKQNEYLGKTRNYLVNKANGEYIIFVDSDNAVKPNMVYDFLYGIYKSKADCLTCHISTFLGKQTPNENTEIANIMLPMGPILELGFTENVFGDANFIIKKSVYQEVGGFAIDRLSLDDWEFLARLSLKGFKQSVIPDTIFWYRVSEDSMVKTGDNYKSLQRIFRAYDSELPNYLRYMINGFIVPLYYKSEIMDRGTSNIYIQHPSNCTISEPENISGKERIKLATKIIFPKTSVVGKIIRKLYKLISKTN
ncbi:glycosyltransferase family 2 protein [Gorillibacterium massiliense]|uniref:glycosyltransferase family 2 protein n=1 Tax=Gorillibacterium massiliense TaxID=1280390 RepID=UPI0004B49B5F|nr:glycosyltransferase family A protein [Gorillibacterium massiliense]